MSTIHRRGVLLDGIGKELVRSANGGPRKTLSQWLANLQNSIELEDLAETFTSGDATPDVSGSAKWITAGSTAITDFDGATEGQVIFIYRGDADITITRNASKIETLTQADVTLTATHPMISFRSVSGVWQEVERADSVIKATDGDTLTLAEWFKWAARGADAPSSNYGYFSDRSTNGDTAFPLKLRAQLALGAGADEDFNTTGGQTWVSTSFEHYFARSATLFSVSPMGGAGAVFATRRGTDSYDGNPVWTSGEAVTAGAKRGYINSNGSQTLYTATTSGTTGATPPTHTTGTASDGTVTWQFTQLQYRTAMGFASLAYNNAADGGSAWGGYIEAFRAAGAGHTHGLEIDIKNGGSNVQVHPYSINTTGATDAINIAAGPTQYGPAAANPVSAAIIFQSNGATTFNKGLVFESTSLTDEGGGVYIPFSLFVGCHIRQHASDGTTASAIQFNATANNERVALGLQNRAIYALCQGAIMGGFESAPAAGTAPDEYLSLIGQAAGTGYASLKARGTASDIDVLLSPKGSGTVRVGGDVLDFGDGDVLVSRTTNKLAFTGATTAAGGYTFDADIFVSGKAVWRTIAAGVVTARNSVNGAGDATETAQATVTIPANALGANGVIKVTILCEQTNSANAKTWRVRFGGISGTQFYSLAATNNALTQTQIIIRNNNATNSQVGYASANAAIFGQTANAKTTGAIDTTAAQDIVVSNFWAGATASESMQLLHYQVEIFHQD